jgi:hypothetical protein
MTGKKGPLWLARLFWIAAAGNVLLVLIPALDELNHPRGEFSGLAALSLLLIDACLAVVIAPADRALAEAIVAGDAAQVARLAPAANLSAPGWGGMSFMRLAMDHDHPGHAVLGSLLRAGLDPDQDSSALYRQITNEKDEALLRMVVDTGVDLNRHMGHGGWLYFVRYDWPEGLALLLDHGADIEVQDATGYTLIMRAAQVGDWPTVETLLSRRARTDRTGNDGRTLRDLLSEAIARERGPIPPAIAELQASLR